MTFIKVYRVYEPVWYDAGASTYEYGIFASHDEALARAKEVWDEKYAEFIPDETKNGLSYFGLDPYAINIVEYSLGESIDKEFIVYT